ncbi:MAG: Crp/Fnr family transcriptional regulator [Bacteroidia bacterium]|jgi:CRP-like cAMP-binding protein|nr:Crp/Fnr family transcriptional regulator [Bacteroidia bacterium]
MIYQVIASVIGQFPDEYKAKLEEISTVRVFERDSIILEQGHNCNHLWFINTGAVKAFEWIDGVERVSHFFLNNMFFTNYYCWVTKKQSDLTYKVVEQSEIIEIDYPKLEALCARYHIFDTIGRKMAERIFVQEYFNKKLLLNYSAKERYEYFEKEQPEIFQHFALKDIASFIGITDVSLSRIRKERIGK